MFPIRCRIRWSGCLLAALTVAPAVSAQRVRLAPAEIAHVADEALRVIVPPEQMLSGIPVARRGIAFDAPGTLAAFGAGKTADSTFRLDRPVDAVSEAVLRDCSQIAPKSCNALGSRAFVTIAPMSLTKSRAHVRVTVEWADPVRIDTDSTTSRHAFLTGFSATIHLVRNARGAWTFERQDPSVLAM